MRRRSLLVGAVGFSFAAASAVALAPRGEKPESQDSLYARIADASRRHFSPEEMRADLAYLCDTLEDVAVFPYAATSRDQFLASRAAVEAGLTRPLDVFGFALRVAPLFASLNDGHISVAPADALWQRGRNGDKLFPVPLSFGANEVSLLRSARYGIPDGSRLLSIDGLSASAIAATCLSCTSAPSKVAQRLFAADWGAVAMWLFALLGNRSKYSLEYEWNGKRLTAAVPACSAAEIRSASESQAGEPVTFGLLSGGSVGYLDYRSCDPGEKLNRGLRAAFERFASANVRALVVDVRKNGGGSDSANDAVLDYLTSRPYVQGTRYSVRASRFLKARYGFFGYVQRYFDPAVWFSTPGSVVTIDVPEVLATTRPGANALRFSGPCYVLVGPATFSSAMGFAETVKDFGIGTLAGEPLSEPLDSNGQVISVRAPHTCLNGSFPTKYFYATRPHTGHTTLQPDIRIATSVADVRSGRDPVLAEILARIAAPH